MPAHGARSRSDSAVRIRGLNLAKAPKHPLLTRPDRVYAENNHVSSMADVNTIVSAFLLFYAGLFPIVNPIGGAPIFLGLTRHCTDEQRNALALRVTINCFFLLLGSMLIGSYVLDFFGITLPIVRIAGGLVVTVTGWNLLQEGDEEDLPSEKPVRPTDAFYPLTMPITVGPGSIAVAITLGSQRPRVADLVNVATLGAAAVAGV